MKIKVVHKERMEGKKQKRNRFFIIKMKREF